MLHRAVLTLLVCSVVAFPTPQELAQVSGTAPDTFLAEFDASALQGGAKGKITVEVHKDWAPRGADRFFQLVQSGFFKNAGVFRVVPNFVVQFGINADPQIQANYRGAAANIQDDPVKQSNKKGTIVFATSGPNTRTTQLFINLNDNTNLDTMGFSPFGRVVKGMENVQKIYAGYGERPDQSMIQTQGNAYLKKDFPQMTFFDNAKIVPTDAVNPAAAAGASGPQAPAEQPWHN